MGKLKVSIGICLLFFMMIVNGHSVGAKEWNDLSDVETFIDSFLQEKVDEEHIPNLTVAVLVDGEVVFEKGYGYADIENGMAVNPETTMFRLGSVSKLFTWTAVMQLVEAGKLDLHTDINEYLDFDIPAELVAGRDKANPKPITLFHLMTHTPGFEDYPSYIFRFTPEEMTKLDYYIREYQPERIFPAGEVMAYSNYGTALAGYIVERVSGMPYEEYIEKHIFQPLNMNYSTFRQPVPEELSHNFAKAYRYIGGEFREGEFEFMPAPAGGMSSSARDMAKFMQAYLAGESFQGERILEEVTIQQMFQQQFTYDSRLDGMTLGWMEKTWNGKRILQHGGSTTLYDTGLFLIPEENIGVFISYSGHNFLTHTELFVAFMDHYFPAEEQVAAASTGGDDLSKYAGEYHQNRKSLTNDDRITNLTIEKVYVQVDDDMLVVTKNREENRFIEVEPGVFKNTNEGHPLDAYGALQTIVFQMDPHGKMMIATDGPMTYSKAKWYESSGFTFLTLILIILSFVGSLLYWAVKAFRTRKKKIAQPKLAVWGKRTAALAGILLLFLVFGIAINGEVNPLYQLPNIALGIVHPISPVIDVIPFILTIIGIIMVGFMGISWKKKYWKVLGRIHYTVLSVMMMHLIWILWFWNVY